MITIKLPFSSTTENEISKNPRARPSKILAQQPTMQLQNMIKPYGEYATSQIGTLQNANLYGTVQEQSKQKLKLPNIRKKSTDITEQFFELVDRKNEEIVYGDELKRLQAHPYLRKYVDMKSQEKIKRENSCNFLNIVSVKPIFRSSSRMSNKDAANLTLNQEKTQKFIHHKEKEEEKLLFESEQSHTISHTNGGKSLHSSGKRRSSNVTMADANRLKQRVNGLPRQTLQPIREKKKSLTLLKIDKPKIIPTYYEWCLLIGLLDGLISDKQGGITYKAFVGKGNNSILVKNVIKNRPWWSLCQDQFECNLFWNQSRHPKFLESLKQGKTATLEWENSPRIKLQLSGNCESGMNPLIRNYVNLGFDKILSKSEKERFSKSITTIDVIYPISIRNIESNKTKTHNHLEFNWNLSNKKALYYNLKSYYLAMGKDPFENIPETYHVQKEGDDQWNNFLKGYENKGLWIVKPGENSNRGCGIDVVETLDEVKDIVRNKSIRSNGKERSHIVQRYLLPFLYNKRKFDIRCYMLVTSINGNLRCYWYEEGYIRTASKQFTTKNLKNRMIHLTNDAVQKHSESYGKHQSGNKLSFNDFHKYMKNNCADTGYDFFQHIYPRMIELAADAIRSTHLVIDAKHREFSFEIFGLDFMIDDNFRTWLIEVNTNPCLELSCPLLARIIPAMVQNAFKVAIDPIFPPPKDITRLRNVPDQLFQSNKFTLIFNSREQSYLQNVLQPGKLHNIIESEDEESHCEDEQ